MEPKSSSHKKKSGFFVFVFRYYSLLLAKQMGTKARVLWFEASGRDGGAVVSYLFLRESTYSVELVLQDNDHSSRLLRKSFFPSEVQPVVRFINFLGKGKEIIPILLRKRN